MASQNRPLSPHLQVYKPQMTSLLSILHRLTGVGLGLGMLLLAWWLIAAALGPEAFQAAQGIVGSVIGRVILFGFTFAFFYHLANGIRHLVWDAGDSVWSCQVKERRCRRLLSSGAVPTSSEAGEVTLVDPSGFERRVPLVP